MDGGWWRIRWMRSFTRSWGFEYISEWASLDFHTPRGKFVLGIVCVVRSSATGAAAAVGAGRSCLRPAGALQRSDIFASAVSGGDSADAAASHRFERPVDEALRVRERSSGAERGGDGGAGGRGGVGLSVQPGRCTPASLRNFQRRRSPMCAALPGRDTSSTSITGAATLSGRLRRCRSSSIRGRMSLSQRGVMADYLKAVSATDTFAILDRYQIRYAILMQGSPAAYLLGHSPQWRAELCGSAGGWVRARADQAASARQALRIGAEAKLQAMASPRETPRWAWRQWPSS